MKKIKCEKVVQKRGIIALLLEDNMILLKIEEPVKITEFSNIIESITNKNPSLFDDDRKKIYPAASLSDEEIILYKKVMGEINS